VHVLESILILAGLAWMALYIVCALRLPEPKDDFMLDLVAKEIGEEKPQPKQESESNGNSVAN
jgi:hypothetical protein